MEQETKDVLGQFAQRLIDMLERGIDVAGQEIPILLNEVLVWGFFSDFLPFTLFLMVCITSLVLIVKNSDMKSGFKKAKDEMAEKLGGLTERDHCRRNMGGHTTQLFQSTHPELLQVRYFWPALPCEPYHREFLLGPVHLLTIHSAGLG